MSARVTCLALGAATLFAVWIWPLPRSGIPGFSAHMTAHMALVAVASPLLALGVAGTRLDPVVRAPWLFLAIPASVLELCAVWAWHAPALHHAARRDGVVLALEQATFLAAGLALWASALGGGAERRRARAAEGVTALLFTSMHMTLLGALLALTPRALYDQLPRFCGAPVSAALDQQIGGSIMLFAGGVAYLAGGVWLVADVLAARSARGAAREGT